MKSAGSASNDVFSNLGYCPQTNCIYEKLTGREMIAFFAALRGISSDSLDAYVDAWISMATLEKYADKPSGTYSGGNKRKLCLAIALVGSPQFAVLDEPSAGVDPAARRKLWHIISSVLADHKTIALTTHHMGEASTLGNNIGIMVKGYLTCIGSAQHLKSLYGKGYEIGVRVRDGGNVDTVAVPLLSSLSNKIEVRDRPSDEYIRVSVGKAGEDFHLSEAYEKLENCKNAGDIQSYLLSQSSLEQVFLSFMRLEKDEEDKCDDNNVKHIVQYTYVRNLLYYNNIISLHLYSVL